MEKPSYVYMLASAPYGTLYIGVTTDIVRRTWQHKEDFIDGFTKAYGVHTLVWYEIHNDLMSAVAREKQLKKWRREWKIKLIHEKNPFWRDLYKEFTA
jgi:putative endonuclease